VGKTEFRSLAALAILLIAGCGAPATNGPSAPPVVSCEGIPASRCDEAIASVARSLPNSPVTEIEVECVAGTCSEQSGAIDTIVTLADGSRLRSTTMSWSDAGAPAPGGVKEPPMPVPEPGIPVVPVEPECQGVPKSMCLTMAETAFGEVSNAAVVLIVVRCTRMPCTIDQGEGETLITYNDGTTLTTSWEYES
jgi:hypothetical protein